MARGKTLRRAAARSAAALIAFSCVSISSAIADDKAAHDLAQRFSADGGSGKKQEKPKPAGLTDADRKATAATKTKISQKKAVESPAPDTKAEEDDMLKRARLEAEERKEAARKALEQEEAEDRRREAEATARKVEEERLAAEQRNAEEKRLADEQRAADEKRQADEHLAQERRADAERRLAAEQRKAKEAEEKRQADEQRIAEEKRAAEETRLAEERRRAEEDERQAEARRFADEVRAAEEKIRQAEEKRIAAEQREAEAAEQRNAEEKRLAEEQRIAEEKRRAEEDRVAEEKRATEAARLAAEAETKAMQDAEEKRLAEQRLRVLERDREEEARRLTAKLNRVAEERMKREAEAANKSDPISPPPQPPQKYGVASEPESVAEPKAPPAAASARALGHVTILLVMDPGTNGIRRYGKKTADPVICAGPTCWAGAGPDHPASEMPRGKALGPGNTLGRRAAACNQKLACVFRDVDLGNNPQALQPIDLRVMRHDRREPLTVAAPGRCEVAGSQLYCADTLKSRTWRAWIIPEDVAERAGPAALTAAVEGGLSSTREADLRSALRQ